ncbi:MAG TPA: hypothetical protein VJ397_08830 [Thermoplasmata archaeon]|nr:hypothetical protein [Thermoplasmata archaeon]
MVVFRKDDKALRVRPRLRGRIDAEMAKEREREHSLLYFQMPEGDLLLVADDDARLRTVSPRFVPSRHSSHAKVSTAHSVTAVRSHPVAEGPHASERAEEAAAGAFDGDPEDFFLAYAERIHDLVRQGHDEGPPDATCGT